MKPLLRCEELCLVYGDGDSRTSAVDEVSLEIGMGEFVGIMGPSGSGKSSLLYLLSGLKRPTHGRCWFGEHRLDQLGESALTRLRLKQFGFVFQQPFLLPYLSAWENVLLAAPGAGSDDHDRIDELFKRLGLSLLKHRMPYKLSGGERQRVCVARAMAHRPDIIFADEPTAALDRANGLAVMDLLASYREHGAVLVVTHDAQMLERADRVLLLQDGRLVTD